MPMGVASKKNEYVEILHYGESELIADMIDIDSNEGNWFVPSKEGMNYLSIARAINLCVTFPSPTTLFATNMYTILCWNEYANNYQRLNCVVPVDDTLQLRPSGGAPEYEMSVHVIGYWPK